MTRGAAGERPPRIGTWNLLYFPDAEEEKQDEDDGTDVAWLSCAIANLDVDILAIQELKVSERAKEKQGELIALLNQRTQGDWRIEAATCEPSEVQHPGFLYDATRVTGSHFRELPELSPDGACSNRVSPGFAGYFQFPAGPDFHLVSVHMEAYPERRSLESRERSLAAFAAVTAAAQALVADQDILFAGDYNTTGCDDCEPKLSSAEEVSELRVRLPQLSPALSLVEADHSCSRPGGGLMDHFVFSPETTELGDAPLANVSGICAETSCSRLREWHEDATEQVSDHCPLTLDLQATDDD